MEGADAEGSDADAGAAAAAAASASGREGLAAPYSPTNFSSASTEPGTSFGAAHPVTWEENTANCSICGAKLGKRHLNPRHHCRLCGRCVCATCSPNTVQLSSHQGPRRACTECLTNVEKTAEMKGRLALLAGRMNSLSGQSSYANTQDVSFEESIETCEKALLPFEKERESFSATQQKVRHLEAEVATAREALARLALRLFAWRRAPPPGGLHAASLREAIAICEDAVGASEAGLPAPAPRAGGGGSMRDAILQAGHGSVREISLAQDDTPPAFVANDLRLPLRGRLGRDIAALSPLDASTVEAPPIQEPAPRGRSTGGKKCLACTAVALVLLAGIVLVSRFVAVPKVAQGAMDALTLTLVGATLSSPVGDTILLSSQITMNNAGPFGAHVQGFRAFLGAGGGETFAWCDFPDVELAGGGPTHANLDVQLHVTDPAGFTAATARILQGYPDEWVISGTPTVRAVGIIMQLKLNKKLQLPATLLDEVRTADIDILSGTESELAGTGRTSFFSSSVLQLAGLGAMVFALHPVGGDGTVQIDVQLGTVSVGNFEVSRGFNVINDTMVTLHKTPASEPYLSEFVGRWLSGTEQTVAIRGPIQSVSAFLDNITTQQIRVAGISKGLIKSSYVSKYDTLEGHTPEGGSCSLLAGNNCLKGPIVVAQNVVHHAVTLTNISMDINVMEDLSYDTVLHTLGIIPKRVSCDRGTRLVRLRSVPGMWAYLNASRAEDSSVEVPPAPEGGGVALTSFFLAGEPQPGQSIGGPCFGPLDESDCCFTTILPAAACRAELRDLTIIPSRMEGNATVVVGDFQITVHVEQTGIPIQFANDVPNFQVGPVTMSCQDFTFH